MTRSAPGRFEIAAFDASIAHGATAAAEEAWRLLTGPLMLPESFSSPIYVRITPAGETSSETVPFHVTVEAGGIVSVRMRAESATLPVVRRALVQGLLMRLAVAHHGVMPWLNAPLWLEHAAVGWWMTRAEPAQLDARRQAAIRNLPPTMEALVNWKRGGAEPAELANGALWLLAFFQSESGRAREWQTLLLRLLKGDDPLAAVAVSFPGMFASAADRELWWRTGYFSACRARTLPVMEVTESRDELASLARFVFSDATGARDTVVPLSMILQHADEPIVAAELARRADTLGRLIPALHPFYRNAGLALGEAFAARAASQSRRDRTLAAFAQDWRDAEELEQATRAKLDQWEGRSPVAP